MPRAMVSTEGEYLNTAEGTSVDAMIHTTLGVSGGIKARNGVMSEQTIQNGLVFLCRALREGKTTDKESYELLGEVEEMLGKTVLRTVFEKNGFAMKVPKYFGVSLRNGQEVEGIAYLRSLVSDEEFESTTRLAGCGIDSVDADEDIGADIKDVCTDLAEVKVPLTKKQADYFGLGKAGEKTVSAIAEAAASMVTWVAFGESSGDDFEAGPAARLKVITK